MAGAASNRRRRRGTIAAAAVLACITAPFAAAGPALPASAPAPAKVVVDEPSPGALAEAIAKVAPGGKVRIRKGRYREALLIEKPVQLVGVGKGRATIDARCQFPETVRMTSGGVVLKDLKIQGASNFAAVDFAGVPSGRAHDLRIRNTCEAEYGINVFTAGAVEITNNRVSGFTDAGIYVGDITSTPNGTLFVGDNDTFGNNKGIIVEFSEGGDIALFSNDVHDNNIPGVGEQVGIWVHGSDGVRIASNQIRNNGLIGLELTPNSDNSSITDNQITGNLFDVRNDGLGNCGSGNIFSTGGPLAAC